MSAQAFSVVDQFQQMAAVFRVLGSDSISVFGAMAKLAMTSMFKTIIQYLTARATLGRVGSFPPRVSAAEGLLDKEE